MESVHGLWTVGRFTESSQGFCVCLYAVNILVLCIAACENSDLVRTVGGYFSVPPRTVWFPAICLD